MRPTAWACKPFQTTSGSPDGVLNRIPDTMWRPSCHAPTPLQPSAMWPTCIIESWSNGGQPQGEHSTLEASAQHSQWATHLHNGQHLLLLSRKKPLAQDAAPHAVPVAELLQHVRNAITNAGVPATSSAAPAANTCRIVCLSVNHSHHHHHAIAAQRTAKSPGVLRVLRHRARRVGLT